MSSRFFVSVCLWLFCVASHSAVTPVSTETWRGNYASSTYVYRSTPQAVCSELTNYSAQYFHAGLTSNLYNVTATNASCDVFFSNGSKWYTSALVRTAVSTSCPANSTGDGVTCLCNAGYVESSGQCVQNVATCTPGSSVSSGYFDGGTSLSGGPRAAACTGGCLVVFDGSFPSGSALVDGVKHYYAKGSYVKTGFQCDSGAGVGIDGGDGNMPVSSASVPSDTCAEGQAQGTVNGKTLCVNQETGNVVPSTSGNQTTSTSSTSTVTNPDGSRTDTTTTTTTAVDGTSTTTTTTTNYRPDGSVSGSTSQSSGTGVDAEAEGDIPGSNDASGFYEKKDLSVASIFGEARDALAASPIGSSVTGFFNISGGGSCPSMTWDVPLFNASAAVDTFCSQGAANMYLVIRGVVLLIAGLMAFRIAIDF